MQISSSLPSKSDIHTTYTLSTTACAPLLGFAARKRGLGGSHGGWEIAAGKGHTDAPCREDLGMEFIYWVLGGYGRIGGIWGGER